MKKKAFAALAAMFVFAICLTACGKTVSEPAPTEDTTQPASQEETVPVSSTDKLYQAIEAAIPEEYLGGMYWDEQRNFVVNVAGGYEPETDSFSIDGRDFQVLYVPVRYSLKALEAMKTLITPYMVSHDMVTLGVDQITNRIVIELYYETDPSKVETLLDSLAQKGLLDRDIVDIEKLPEGERIKFTEE